MRKRGHLRHRESIHQPATANTSCRNGAGDHGGCAQREHGLGAVRLQDTSSLTHHHQAGGSGQKEHREQPRKNTPVARFVVGRRCGRILHSNCGDTKQHGGDRGGHQYRAGQRCQRRTQSIELNGPTKQWCADHRTQRIQTDHVTIGQTAHLGDRLIHALLHQHERQAATQTKQHAVTDGQLQQAVCTSRQQEASGAGDTGR